MLAVKFLMLFVDLLLVTLCIIDIESDLSFDGHANMNEEASNIHNL